MPRGTRRWTSLSLSSRSLQRQGQRQRDFLAFLAVSARGRPVPAVSPCAYLFRRPSKRPPGLSGRERGGARFGRAAAVPGCLGGRPCHEEVVVNPAPGGQAAGAACSSSAPMFRAGLTIRGVRKISSSVRLSLRDLVRKSTPSPGISPRKGTFVTLVEVSC